MASREGLRGLPAMAGGSADCTGPGRNRPGRWGARQSRKKGCGGAYGSGRKAHGSVVPAGGPVLETRLHARVGGQRAPGRPPPVLVLDT